MVDDDAAPVDWIDGQPVPALVVTETAVLAEHHQGSVWLRPGADLTLRGSHQGSLHLDIDATATIAGTHQGSLHVAARAVVTISGVQQGSVHLGEDARVQVEATGRLAGSLHGLGQVLNAGVRGGTVNDDVVVTDLPGSRVKEPALRDGHWVYVWGE